MIKLQVRGLCKGVNAFEIANLGVWWVAFAWLRGVFRYFLLAAI